MKVMTSNYGEFNVNSYYAIDEKTEECVIVDPGGNAHLFIEEIKLLKIKPVGIIITHGHFDHISAVNELKQCMDIPVITHAQEADIMNDWEENLSYKFVYRKITAKADRFIEDHEVIDLGGELVFKAILVPGHSINSVCYYQEKCGILFTGDTLMNLTMGRTDFYKGKQNDLAKNIKSKLYTLPGATLVYPGHGLTTSIQYEASDNIVV